MSNDTKTYTLTENEYILVRIALQYRAKHLTQTDVEEYAKEYETLYNKIRDQFQRTPS